MKYLLIAFLLAMLASSFVARADTLTPEQAAIKTFIKKLYAISFNEFEAATFGAKYKNCEEIVKGKHDPDRQCRLLAEFLVKEAIIRKKGIHQGCMAGVNGYFRYPGLDGMDLSPVECADPPPVLHINTPIVNGDKAMVHVTFPKVTGDNFYYLRKMPEGWRIYKVETRENTGNPERIEESDTVNVFPPEEQSK